MLRVSCCDTKWSCTAGWENLGDVIVPAIVERACPPARRDGELERKGRILVDLPSTGRCRFCTDGRADSWDWSGSCSSGQVGRTRSLSRTIQFGCWSIGCGGAAHGGVASHQHGDEHK